MGIILSNSCLGNITMKSLTLVTLLITFISLLLSTEENNEDFINKCIEAPKNKSDEQEEIDLFDENPEFWEIECDDETDCPSDWHCSDLPDIKPNICYAPAYLPSYYRDLAPPDVEKVVEFKINQINCSSSLPDEERCDCVEGYECKNDTCRRGRSQSMSYRFYLTFIVTSKYLLTWCGELQKVIPMVWTAYSSSESVFVVPSVSTL